MENFSKFVLLISCSFFINTSFAWTSHGLLTFLAVKDFAEISSEPTVPAESLAIFVEKEQQGLVKLQALELDEAIVSSFPER